jgi:hypothetical protein
VGGVRGVGLERRERKAEMWNNAGCMDLVMHAKSMLFYRVSL